MKSFIYASGLFFQMLVLSIEKWYLHITFCIMLPLDKILWERVF